MFDHGLRVRQSYLYPETELNAFPHFRRSGQQHSKWHVVVSPSIPVSIAVPGSIA